MEERDLIYDWNEAGERWEKPPFRVQFDDETLRDGLQSPSVRSPVIEDKLAVLHLMDRLGIDTADIGLPGAGPHVVRDVMRLAQEIAKHRLKIQANCAARTLKQDITPVVEISQQTGIPIEVCTFIGSSPIRQYAENWTLEQMLRHTDDAVSYAVAGQGAPALAVGDWKQTEPPKMDRDVDDLVQKRKISVYVVEEDLVQRGIEKRELIAGVKPLSRAALPGMCAEHTIVSHW